VESAGVPRSIPHPTFVTTNNQPTANRRVEDGIVENGGKWVG
jgi:hypothetical protein